eukprot:4505018-Amphidinium_carterae.1
MTLGTKVGFGNSGQLPSMKPVHETKFSLQSEALLRRNNFKDQMSAWEHSMATDHESFSCRMRARRGQ